MMEQVLERAAYNNAVWCDAVCATHSGRGEFASQHWLTRHGAPEYYPDLVTLTGAADVTQQTEALTALMRSSQGRNISVKDSFNCLNLGAFGFEPLFDAEWLVATKLGGPGLGETGDMTWVSIDNDTDLARWEQAWRQGAGSGKPRMFRQDLLLSPGIRFVCGVIGDEIVSGGVLAAAGGVTGLSNIFATGIAREAALQGLAKIAWMRHPAQPLVSYDRGANLAVARRVGFAALGQLRVWVRSVDVVP